MSLTGSIKGETLKGNINRLYELRGYSAYEVAVLEGFEGTEEEWLASLVGPQGPQGDRGNSGVYIGSGDMPEDCNVQIDPDGDTLSEEDIVGDINEQIADIESEVGNSKEALALSCGKVQNGSYVTEDGGTQSQKGCHIYSYAYPLGDQSELAGKTIKIKTYMYGDMAVVDEFDDANMTTPYLNSDADVEANPESGIFECEVMIDPVFWMGGTIKVSFCENPYLDAPEVYIKHGSVWQEIKKLNRDKVSEDSLYNFILTDYPTYSDTEDIVTSIAEDIVGQTMETITISPDKIIGSNSWANELNFYDLVNIEISNVVPNSMLKPSFNSDGVSFISICDTIGLVVEDIRFFKEVTLTQTNQSIYFAFPQPVSELWYIQANVINISYNARVTSYELDYNPDEPETVYGVFLGVTSDIPEGETSQVTVSAHLYTKTY